MTMTGVATATAADGSRSTASVQSKLDAFIEAGGEICTLSPDNSLAVSNLINANASESDQYASYYPAMIANFMPKASAIAKDASGKIVGTSLNMFRAEDKSIIGSHFKTAAGHEFLQDALLQHAEESAIENYGAKTILAKSGLLNGSSQSLKTLGLSPEEDPILITDIEPDYMDEAHGQPIVLRRPTLNDAQGMLDVVLDTNKINDKGGLDIYALESYERMCTDFAATSMVATTGGKIVGFITGFLMPGTPESELFIWQIGVDTDGQGKGIGGNMLIELAKRSKATGFVTTIEENNMASQRVFQKLADQMGIGFRLTRDKIETNMLSNPEDAHPHQPEHVFRGGNHLQPT